MKKIINLIKNFLSTKGLKWAVAVSSAAAVVILSIVCSIKSDEVKTLKSYSGKQLSIIESQAVAIDSLSRRKAINANVSMSVTDKSKNVVRGRKNSGTIELSSDKSYKMVLDSISINFLK